MLAHNSEDTRSSQFAIHEREHQRDAFVRTDMRHYQLFQSGLGTDFQTELPKEGSSQLHEHESILILERRDNGKLEGRQKRSLAVPKILLCMMISAGPRYWALNEGICFERGSLRGSPGLAISLCVRGSSSHERRSFRCMRLPLPQRVQKQ